MLMDQLTPQGLILVIQRGKYDYDRAELLAAEKCAGLNVFRVTVLALRVFKGTLIS